MPKAMALTLEFFFLPHQGSMIKRSDSSTINEEAYQKLKQKLRL